MTSGELVGKGHQDLRDWLTGHWWAKGPPVAVVQGFPGVGKTEIGRRVRAAIGSDATPIVSIDMPPGRADQTTDLLLTLGGALDTFHGISTVADAVMAKGKGKARDLMHALEACLRQPLLVIIDEFQRAVNPTTGEPNDQALADLVRRVAGRTELPGKLLLLTSQRVLGKRWSDGAAVRTLRGLSAEDGSGAVYLGMLLHDLEREDEVPTEERADVAAHLGGNPRAIKLLVAALEAHNLEQLLGEKPEPWEARERDVSPELVRELELDLLERVLARLSDDGGRFLRQLSTYRTAVDKHGLEVFGGAHTPSLQTELSSRFLLEHHRGWYELNPVAREVARFRLDEDPARAAAGHSKAATHYTRHFLAQQMVNTGRLGGHFVEARYHLVAAGRPDDLGEIVGRFSGHLRRQFGATDPIPTDPAELDQRIAVLAALLGESGPQDLEYLLARYFAARNRPGDVRRALLHAARATSDARSPVDAWRLRARLEHKVNGVDRMLIFVRRAVEIVPPEHSLQLYQLAGKTLVAAGRLDDAIDLLQEGITRIPPERSLFQLYQLGTYALALSGRPEAAFTLAMDGLDRIPSHRFGRHKLAEGASRLAAGERREEWLLEVRASATQPTTSAVAALIHLLRGDVEGAAHVLLRAEAAPQTWLPTRAALALVKVHLGDASGARDVLDAHTVEPHQDSALAWLLALIAIDLGDNEGARQAWAAFKGVAANEVTAPTRAELLRAWDHPPVLGVASPSYFFPVLGPAMTGRDEIIARRFSDPPGTYFP